MAGKRHPSHRCAIARIAVARPWMCRHFILLSLFIAIKRKGNEKRPLYPKSFTLVSSCIEESVKKKKKKNWNVSFELRFKFVESYFKLFFKCFEFKFHVRFQLPSKTPQYEKYDSRPTSLQDQVEQVLPAQQDQGNEHGDDDDRSDSDNQQQQPTNAGDVIKFKISREKGKSLRKLIKLGLPST